MGCWVDEGYSGPTPPADPLICLLAQGVMLGAVRPLTGGGVPQCQTVLLNQVVQTEVAQTESLMWLFLDDVDLAIC